MYIDTGLEYPEIREFVKTISNVTWLKPEMNFKKVIETYGYPLISKEVSYKIDNARKGGCCKDDFIYGTMRERRYNGGFSMVKWKWLLDSNIKISNKCCDVMKKKPAKQFEKQTGYKPIIATMACESQQRKNAWLKNGCNAFESVRPISQPMSFWTEQDVLEYLHMFNIPYASVYGDIKKDNKGKYYTTGCDRTGCVFCAFGINQDKEPNRFQRLKITHPKLWNYCMRPWDKGGLGMKEVLNYIGIKIE